ncbi:hypothetical protein ACFQ51_34600 [Streptomyces kaempferi]
MLSIDRDSREFVGAEVSALVNGRAYNPTADVVEFAFTGPDDTRPTDWHAGVWDTPPQGASSYRAQVLIGPGGSGPELDPGTYRMWLRVTDSPERPVIPVGALTIT